MASSCNSLSGSSSTSCSSGIPSPLSSTVNGLESSQCPQLACASIALSANNSDDVGVFPRILGSFSSAQLSVPSGRIDAQQGNRLHSFNVA
jgi:hypothetical protein